MFEQEAEFELKEKLDKMEKKTDSIKKDKTISCKTPTSQSNTIEELWNQGQVGGVTKQDFIDVYKRGFQPSPTYKSPTLGEQFNISIDTEKKCRY